MLKSLFNEVAVRGLVTLLKRDSDVGLVGSTKFFGATIFTVEYFWWLLLNYLYFKPCSF